MSTRPILEGADGFAKVCDTMIAETPAAIGKLGTIEFELTYYRFKTRKQGYPVPVPVQMLGPLCRNAGMFPPTQDMALRMADELLKSILYFTVVSPWWSVSNSVELYNSLSKPADFVSLQSLECFLSPNPSHWWTARLAPHTKVLVLTPFASSIESQIPHLDKIWSSRPGFWNPTTKFRILPFPSSYGIQSKVQQNAMLDRWTDSFGLLADFKKQMDSIDYDIVILGVGIYSLPLMAHAKQRGKRAIHLGGPTQLLFGIRGGRWDTMSEFQELFNEHWIRPSVEERPTHYTSVEGGCYW